MQLSTLVEYPSRSEEPSALWELSFSHAQIGKQDFVMALVAWIKLCCTFHNMQQNVVLSLKILNGHALCTLNEINNWFPWWFYSKQSTAKMKFVFVRSCDIDLILSDVPSFSLTFERLQINGCLFFSFFFGWDQNRYKTTIPENRSFHGHICRTLGARPGNYRSWPMAHHQQYQSLLSQRLYEICSFTLSAELSQSSEILTAVPGMLVASVFGQELFLLHFHSADHVGLEGHYHWLLQLIVFVSLLATLATMFLPTSFSSVLLLSISVAFQGCWFMNMGFMLWTPEFVPQGCIMQLAESSSDSMHGAVTCNSHEADVRARALANLQFSWILSGILIFTGIICLKFAGKSTPRAAEYEQLQIRGSDVPITIDSFKQADP
ncbi:uncharacterized protein LOC111298431 [Durio zibethinus]|uniref:Uncharacterized protein LOC111298431 n=1 Tax=Durio zibethinus TaxID=66656 RepID=A0A6P5Z8N3_DURZI|nr:uncharacterized protein LOC111298431 [Durio zibethinus]